MVVTKINKMKLTRRSKIDTKQIVKLFQEKHGEYYDYSKVVYKTMHDKVIIGCPIHGDFLQIAKHHENGKRCNKCARVNQTLQRTNTTENFILQAKSLHGEKYDYSKVIYGKNSLQKVLINCPEHGDFLMPPNSHVSGKQGCPKCGRANREHWNTGFSKTKWVAKCEGKIAILYIVRLFNNEESFYKIGITSRPIKTRAKDFAHEYEVLVEIKSDNAEMIFDLEKTFLKHHKPYKYKPKLSFDGETECFSKIDFKLIKENNVWMPLIN